MLNLKNRLFKTLAASLGFALIATLIGSANPANAAYNTPIIATVSPSTGTITGGETVTVTGAFLNTASHVYLGGSEVNYWRGYSVATDGTWMKFEAPYVATPGLVDITLAAGINVTEPKVYTYTATSITSVTPAFGPEAGGTAISIKGTGFGPMIWGDASLLVKVGGKTATKVVRVSPTEITAVTPDGPIGKADVVVSFVPGTYQLNYSGNVITATQGFEYKPGNIAPTITSISPNKGSTLGGNTITINGTNLKDVHGVQGVFTFDGITAPLTSINPAGTQAIVTSPAHALGAVDVKVVTPAGQAVSAKGFTYSPPPTLTSVTANSGVTNGGTKVTLKGTNFGTAGAPVVKFGGKLALCTKLVDSSTITAVTRDGAAGAVDVEVTATTGAGSATLAGSYTYRAPASTPVVSSITPNSGPTTGGGSVDIKSSTAWPADLPNVMFGQLCAATVTRVDDYTIRAVVPAGTAGAKNVSLTFDTAYSVANLGYTYFLPNPPVVTSATPNNSYITGGDFITIVGRGFGTTGTPTVTFGGVAATNVTRVSDTLIYAYSPANTEGTKDIVVTPAAGNDNTNPITGTGLFKYRGPSILSISPNTGGEAGGTQVIIKGDGFGLTGTPTVTFDGVAATSILRVDSQTVIAVSPAHAKGAVDVVLTPVGGSAITGKGMFTYLPENFTPLIFYFSPNTGPQAGGITITVNGKNFKSTDGSASIITLGGVVPTNIVINAEGTSMTFTAPAFGPGYYDFSVTTNKGRAWQTLYRVLPPPTVGDCNTSVTTKRLNPDGGTTSTVYGQNFGTTADAPTIKIDGVVSPVTGWGYDNYYKRYYVNFTDLGGSFGYKSLEVIPADFSGTVSIGNCLFRQSDATITADDKGITFGDPTPPFTKTVVGEKGTDKVTTVTYTFTGTNGLTYGPSTTPPTAAGRYTITPSNGVMNPGNIANYSFAYIDGIYTISGKPSQVYADDKEKIYGDADPSFTTTLTGFQDGETQKTVTLTFEGTDTAGHHYGPSTTPPKNAGTYTITPSDEKLNSGNESSYSIEYFTGKYEIKRRPVSIVSPDQSKIYGDGDPALPWEFKDPANTNMAYDETLLVGKLSRVAGESVGAYQQTIGELYDKNPNYDISYELGVLTINKRHITITVDNKEKIYGFGDPTYTFSVVGLQFEDKLSGSVTRDTGENVGDYNINQGTLDVPNANNYILDSFTPGVLKIKPRPITVEPIGQSKIYGELDPASMTNPVVGTGIKVTSDWKMVGSDGFTGTFGRDTGEDVGEYNITQGSVTAGSNYTITFTTGKKFKINKRPIVLVADDATKVYGDADPSPFTWHIKTGVGYYDLVNGDTVTGDPNRASGENVGNYAIKADNMSVTSNYSVSFESGKLTITPRPITIQPDNQSKQYGDNNPTYTYTVIDGSYAFEETSLNGRVTREYGENVGDYNYTNGTFWYYDPNYTVTVDKSKLFTITKKSITVTAIAKSKIYGNNDPTLTWYATPSSMTNGAPINLTGDLGRDVGEDVGQYDITQGTLDGGDNFIITGFTSAKLTINKRTIHVRAADKSSVYYDALPTNTVQVSDGYTLGWSDALDSATFTYAGGVTPFDAGDYTIQASDVTFSTGTAGNYNIYYDNGTLTITPVEIEITADDKSKTYGDSDPAFTYTVTKGQLFGEDSLSGSLTRDGGEDVGSYNITVGTVSGGKNYKVTVVGGKLTINKLHVKVTPDALKKKYGQNDPSFTYSTDVTLPFEESLSGSLSRTEGEDVNKYDFTLGTITNENNSNYDIELVPGQFEIEKRDLTITADPQTKEYGADDPTLTYTTDPATLENGLTFTITGGLLRDNGSAIGEYDITNNNLDAGSNFNIIYVGAKLTITKRKITITADNQSVEYGKTLPGNSYQLTSGSLAYDDKLGTSATYTYSTVPPVNAGDYDITPSDVVFDSGSADNYDITYVDGTLTITPIAIEVTADAVSKTYGDDDPAFTWKVTSGALLGEDTLTGDLSRDLGESVGDYTINQGALANPNYTITFKTGKLTINKKKIKVTPDAGQKKTYGDKDGTFTFATDPASLPFGDKLDGALGRKDGENVGKYDFTLGDLAEKNTNYDIELDPAQYEITKRDITVTIKDATKVYGDADPAFEFTYDPATLETGETITLSGKLSRDSGEDVGSYNITQGTLNGGDNFNLVGFTGGKLTITKRALKIVADDKSVAYGKALPDNSFTLAEGYTLGFSDKLGTASYDYSSATPLHVGVYDIIPSDLTFDVGSADNYDIEYVNGVLTVTKGQLTIYLENAYSSYGDAAPEFRVASTDGLADGDAIGSIDFTFDESSTVPTLPGTYSLGGSLNGFETGSFDDYDVTVVPAAYLIDVPQVLQLDEETGPLDGGTCVTIYGSGFGFNTPTITFDGIEATSVTFVDSGTLIACTPAHTEGTVNVQMTTEAGTFDLGNIFTYIPPVPAPSIDSVTPDNLPVTGGVPVVIRGQNFCGSDGNKAQVLVGGMKPDLVIVSADCQSLVFVMKGMPAGNYTLEVSTIDGTAKYEAGITFAGSNKKKIVTYLIFKGDRSALLPTARKELKRIAAILRGKANVEVNIQGWVHRTASTRIDAALSLARAKRSAAYLRALGVVAKFTVSSKGIYRIGDWRDRRAEITVTYTDTPQ